VPVGVRTVSRAGFGAAAVVVAIGAASVMIALASSAQRAGLLAQSVHGGLPGLLLMAVISIAYLPNAVIWACAYAVGPGFAVGAKTSVSLLGSHLGAVPALPLLAALPDDGKPAPLAWLAFSGPLAAGIFAGWLLARALPFSAASGSSPWWVRYRVAAIGWGLAAGALAGLTLGVLASLSGGPLGPGRMATVGPSPWRVGVAAAVEVGLLAAATLCLLAWRSADRDRAITI
jgi:1,4-dihydroxy-2-naphthoate octaprenyltransferase